MAKRAFKIVNTVREDPYITIGTTSSSNEWWRFGRDNLFPQAIAILNRKSTVHRGIIQSKARYISGKMIACDEKDKALVEWVKNCNAYGENLRDVVYRIALDMQSFGNAYVEFVTDLRRSFLNIYHQDATKCRLRKDKKAILLLGDWRNPIKSEMKEIALYPEFTEGEDGMLRSVVHMKDYEPEFENYGVMEWIAGMAVSAIAYKTDKWNISRLDNSFNSSGVFIVSGEFKDDDDYAAFTKAFDEEFIGEGKQGKVMLLAQRPGADPDAGSRFIPLSQSSEGDWRELHLQSTDDLVIAHGWYRSLSGIADNTGFDTNRILNEYEVALNTVILDRQEKMLNIIRKVLDGILRMDGSSMSFVNRPPSTAKPAYMMIWEARKADGLPYDETDPAQQMYLANINQAKTITIA